jgi:hypothetical protein
VIAFDFKDAFGSIPHDLLKCNLEKFEMYNEMAKVILDFYSNTGTNIMIVKGTGSEILRKR